MSNTLKIEETMMKNRYLYAICLTVLTLGFSACQNEDLVSDAASVSSSAVTLSGSIATNAQSRAQVQLGNTDISTEYFLWNAGDSFSLYDLGESGTTTPLTLDTFTISSDYSDDSPSSSASFTGDCGISEGNAVAAFYPAQSTVNSEATVALSIASTTSLDANADEEVIGYLADNMFMYATSTFSGSGTSLVFNHLTSMARIVYTNSSSTEQTISSVSITGDGAYFGTEATFAIVGAGITTTSKVTEVGLTFSGLTVAAGESEEFYLLFFSGDNFNEGGTLTFTFNDQSIYMETSKILTSNFTTAYRYKFNIRQTDDGLEWVNSDTAPYVADYSLSLSYLGQSDDYDNTYLIFRVEFGTDVDYVVVEFPETEETAGWQMTLTNEGEYIYQIPQTLATGTYTVTATAYKDDVAVTTSTVEIDYTAPEPDYLIGYMVEVDNDCYVTVTITSLGAQVDYVRLVCVQGTPTSTEVIQMVADGTVDYWEFSVANQVASWTVTESGTYSMFVIVYDSGEAVSIESFTYDFVAPEMDYSLGVSFVSQSTDYDSQKIVAELTAMGSDVEYVRLALISGSTVSESDIAAITSGSVDYIERTSTGEVTFTWDEDLASGTYTVVAVAYSEGEVVATESVTFDYTAPSPDYSLAVTFVSQSTDYDKPQVVAEVTEFGSHLKYALVALISGSSVSDSDIEAITVGTISSKRVSKTAEVTISLDNTYASGTYTLVAVGYTSSEAVTTATETFYYTAPVPETNSGSTGSGYWSGGNI